MGPPSTSCRPAANAWVVGSSADTGWMKRGQGLDRVEHPAQGHHHEHDPPGQGLGPVAEPQHQPDHEQGDRPPGHEQDGDHRQQPEPERGHVEGVEGERRQRHHPDAHDQLGQPEQGDPGDQLQLAQGRHHQAEQVARPGLLHEAGRDGDLGLVDDVPEHDPGQQVGDPGLGGRAGPALAGEEHPREPNSTVSTIGHTVTSNSRCGLRSST
jgi:hypothetical protein